MSTPHIDTAFEVDGLGIVYDLERTHQRTFWEAAQRAAKTGKLRSRTPYWAIRDISFTLRAGETLGIVGRNGSGKSTLLLALASILLPDEGTVRCYGRPVLASLGSGFNPDLSGRDNIYLNGAFLGFGQREIDAMVEPIIEFSELGDFIDVPLKQYSTGMKSRLAFAIGTYARPDILLLDEVLSGGDPGFKEKAQERMQEMMAQARAMIIASHSTAFINDVSSKVLWLDRGRLMAFGEPSEVLPKYLQAVAAERRGGAPVRAIA